MHAERADLDQKQESREGEEGGEKTKTWRARCCVGGGGGVGESIDPLLHRNVHLPHIRS